MSRQSRREARKKKKLMGSALAIAAVAAMALFAFLSMRGGGREFDAVNCPQDGRYAGQAAILVDPSDTLRSVQLGAGIERLIGEADKLPVTTEIRLYAVGGAGRGDTTAVFRVCKPVDPDSVSRLTGNPELAGRRYVEEFRAPLQAALERVLNTRPDNASPIIEAVQVSTVNAFRPPESAAPRHLLLMSDMMQHTRDYSFFRDPVEFGAFVDNTNYGTLRARLSDVSVTVFLLARRGSAGRVQALDMRDFWEDYFFDQEAQSPRWVRVEG